MEKKACRARSRPEMYVNDINFSQYIVEVPAAQAFFQLFLCSNQPSASSCKRHLESVRRDLTSNQIADTSSLLSLKKKKKTTVGALKIRFHNYAKTHDISRARLDIAQTYNRCQTAKNIAGT